MDNNLKRKVSDLINNSNQARATVNSAFVPEMIYSVIWKDLRPSRNSNEVWFINISVLSKIVYSNLYVFKESKFSSYYSNIIFAAEVIHYL